MPYNTEIQGNLNEVIAGLFYMNVTLSLDFISMGLLGDEGNHSIMIKCHVFGT